MFLAVCNDSPEAQQVPQLSIIVPFQRDEAALESTLLSVLEAKTDDHELIIVHSGEYSDPYQLGDDEAVVVETEPGLSIADQLNVAAAAACSPFLQVLLAGTQVEAGWSDASIECLQDPQVHAVCVPVLDTKSGDRVFGLDGRELPHRRLAKKAKSSGGPILAGTILRRKSALKMGGWSNAVHQDLIDLELTLLMNAIDLRYEVVEESIVKSSLPSLSPSSSNFEIGKGCGMIACAYSEIPDSGVELEPLARRLGHLATGLMNPKLAAERLGWVLGVRDRSLVARLSDRVEKARQSLESQTVPMRTPDTAPVADRRRAA